MHFVPESISKADTIAVRYVAENISTCVFHKISTFHKHGCSDNLKPLILRRRNDLRSLPKDCREVVASRDVWNTIFRERKLGFFVPFYVLQI